MTDNGGLYVAPVEPVDPRWRTEWTTPPTREEASQPGTLRINRDKIPAAIDLFRNIKQRMDKLTEEAQQALRTEPMADDRVSMYVSEQLTAKGLTDPECAYNAIKAFSTQLQNMIDRLEATQRTMSTIEDTNRRQLQGGHHG